MMLKRKHRWKWIRCFWNKNVFPYIFFSRAQFFNLYYIISVCRLYHIFIPGYHRYVSSSNTERHVNFFGWKSLQLSCVRYFQRLRTIKWFWTNWTGSLHTFSRWLRIQCDTNEWSYYQPTSWVLLVFDGQTRVRAHWGLDTSNFAKHCDWFTRSCSNRVRSSRYTNGNARCWQYYSASCECYSTPTFSVSNTTATNDTPQSQPRFQSQPQSQFHFISFLKLELIPSLRWMGSLNLNRKRSRNHRYFSKSNHGLHS